MCHWHHGGRLAACAVRRGGRSDVRRGELRRRAVPPPCTRPRAERPEPAVQRGDAQGAGVAWVSAGSVASSCARSARHSATTRGCSAATSRVSAGSASRSYSSNAPAGARPSAVRRRARAAPMRRSARRIRSRRRARNEAPRRSRRHVHLVGVDGTSRRGDDAPAAARATSGPPSKVALWPPRRPRRRRRARRALGGAPAAARERRRPVGEDQPVVRAARASGSSRAGHDERDRAHAPSPERAPSRRTSTRRFAARLGAVVRRKASTVSSHMAAVASASSTSPASASGRSRAPRARAASP